MPKRECRKQHHIMVVKASRYISSIHFLLVSGYVNQLSLFSSCLLFDSKSPTFLIELYVLLSHVSLPLINVIFFPRVSVGEQGSPRGHLRSIL